jgi:hypothetical protein
METNTPYTNTIQLRAVAENIEQIETHEEKRLRITRAVTKAKEIRKKEEFKVEKRRKKKESKKRNRQNKVGRLTRKEQQGDNDKEIKVEDKSIKTFTEGIEIKKKIDPTTIPAQKKDNKALMLMSDDGDEDEESIMKLEESVKTSGAWIAAHEKCGMLGLHCWCQEIYKPEDQENKDDETDAGSGSDAFEEIKEAAKISDEDYATTEIENKVENNLEKFVKITKNEEKTEDIERLTNKNNENEADGDSNTKNEKKRKILEH